MMSTIYLKRAMLAALMIAILLMGGVAQAETPVRTLERWESQGSEAEDTRPANLLPSRCKWKRR
jgi:hypothetical protein